MRHRLDEHGLERLRLARSEAVEDRIVRRRAAVVCTNLDEARARAGAGAAAAALAAERAGQDQQVDDALDGHHVVAVALQQRLERRRSRPPRRRPRASARRRR
jgi:Tfp pilus assembly protein FimT